MISLVKKSWLKLVLISSHLLIKMSTLFKDEFSVGIKNLIVIIISIIRAVLTIWPSVITPDGGVRFLTSLYWSFQIFIKIRLKCNYVN